ncbi:Alpha-mannosidase I MNS4 [Cocos nucifera]|uniref:alpha-1,2-Mannosidase n=1 Tax=Cocos nucifera TaxID=13894 RepID=A0A8K0IC60_COCNU|nr:Alpha-mannosidase I MNS4 [Cocos nucifera]
MGAKVAVYFLIAFAAVCPLGALADGVSPSEAKQLRDEVPKIKWKIHSFVLLCRSGLLCGFKPDLEPEQVVEHLSLLKSRFLGIDSLSCNVREMFYHAFDGYMHHAFPLDELRPLTCKGEDTLGGYALTLIDSLDTLALLCDRERFSAAIEWVGKNVRFDIDKTVSVFETTIRVLGGLLSAHLIASDYATITSTAGGGTLTLEFGVLSRLTNNPTSWDVMREWDGMTGTILFQHETNTVFEHVTKNAVRGIWARRSKINLVGAHINVFTGEWTQKDAGIGTSIDSFYEYLLKLDFPFANSFLDCSGGSLNLYLKQAYLLFGDEEYLFMFQEAYKAAMHYLHHDPWYVEVNMNSAATVWPLFNSLQAFWPGLQVLAGDIDPAVRTHAAFFSVWKKYGFTPEGFNLATLNVQSGQKSYPLRPELMESTYWLFKATRDPSSLFQVKYLWLLFDLAVGPDNIVENGPYKYMFSTEGHLLPATPEISLVSEHCSYFGAFCKGDGMQEYPSMDTRFDHQETNDTQFHGDWDPSIGHSKVQNSFSTSGFIKGRCPGLTHGQKFGILYVENDENTYEPKSMDHPQKHSVVVISNPTAQQILDADEDNTSSIQETNQNSERVANLTDSKEAETFSEEMQQVDDTS